MRAQESHGVWPSSMALPTSDGYVRFCVESRKVNNVSKDTSYWVACPPPPPYHDSFLQQHVQPVVLADSPSKVKSIELV